MGCRTANGWDVNGLGQKKDGRGNICPVTIILPTLAMEAKQAYARSLEPKEIRKITLADSCAAHRRFAFWFGFGYCGEQLYKQVYFKRNAHNRCVYSCGSGVYARYAIGRYILCVGFCIILWICNFFV
jgi:hypothetical protein